MKTLIIAEKAKAAEAIAESLGTVNVVEKNKFLKVYEVLQKDIYVIPLRGHILEYRNSDRYKSWSNSNAREIITNTEAIEKVPKSYAFPYIKALKAYGKKCRLIIIATDADIEGCNIGLSDALPFITKTNKNIVVKQIWLSSLEKNEIIEKFNNTIPPKYSWAESGEARAILDAIIGFSATRQVTLIIKPLLEKINRKFTSIGRVQTSLLYLIYLRDKEIKKFIPEPYLTIEAILDNENNIFKAYHQSNPFKKNQFQIANEIYEKIKNEKIAYIINNTSKLNYLNPPAPLNTSKALILLTKNLHINANLALNILNDLYLDKIITYPRTDSDVYKPSFNHEKIIQKFKNHMEYKLYSQNLVLNKKFNPTKGKKDAGDHPPITPIECLELNSNRFKNKLQSKVYDLLVRHYLALFGEKAVESRVLLKLSIKDELFNSQLASLVSEGFLEIAPFLKRKYDSYIKIKNNFLPIKKINLSRKETKPNPEYNDTTLLKLMEKNNLGTKSTRPGIIQILEKRGLILKEKRKYKISELGIFLIEILEKIWLPFLKPDFTRMIENLLEDIKEGNKKKEVVIDTVKKIFLELFDKLLNNKNIISTEITQFKVKNLTSKRFDNNIKNLTSTNCPFCKKEKMKLIKPKNKPKFLICLNDNCQEKYLSVPKKGTIFILRNSTCLKCGFNIFKINYKKDKKSFSYHLCPYCWSLGFKEKVSGKGFCSNCNDFKIENNKCVSKKI